jgi:radical SAM protein with 4Fe4S-binding SPASM domain
MLSHMELGKINQDSFQEVWRKNKGLLKLRHRYDISLENFAECAPCIYRPYCTGNCPGLAFTLTGNVNQPSPDACLQRFLAQGGKMPILAESA